MDRIVQYLASVHCGDPRHSDLTARWRNQSRACLARPVPRVIRTLPREDAIYISIASIFSISDMDIVLLSSFFVLLLTKASALTVAVLFLSDRLRV